MRFRSLIAVSFALVVGLVVTACGAGSATSTQSSSPIRIGALYPTTGSLATLGNVTLHGEQLSVDMTNAQGGINGRKIELVLGNADTAADAVSETSRLVVQEKVTILTGTYASDLAIAASGEAARHDTFYWETSASADSLTSRGLKNFFQFAYKAGANGALAVNLLREVVVPKLGLSSPLKLMIVHNDSSYAVLVATGAEAEAKKAGFNVVGNEQYASNANDLTPLVLQIAKAQPDAVIASSYANDAVLIQRGLKQQNVNLKAFVGTGGIYGLDSFATPLGSAVNGLFDTEGTPDLPTSALSSDSQKLSQQFKTQYQQKYGSNVDFLSALGFAATWYLLHDVIAKAKSLSPADLSVTARALNMSKGSTILGYGIHFNSDGYNELSFPVGKQWQNGKLALVYPSNTAQAQAIDVPLPAWSAR